ncbi:peroxidase 1-like [Lolium perenne]|uniref:peroxidase 1-like n=1 Tax=Lolium perenne TaxID=4522 RepID=UPI0021F553F2|nr:peroxidase 1-like [Lolium perenne]
MAIRCFLLPLSLLLLAASSAAAQLEIGYYSKSCPSAEAIVREEMVKIIAAAPSLAGPLLRLHFHDCFVRGCDASVLLDSTPGNTAERDAKPNKSLRGFGSVERVKGKLEAACPGVVSCADVLTLMARDAVVLARGPFWPVALGRRDGKVSDATEASHELPPAFGDVPLLAKIFASKGLDLKDLVVLSGAHTLGTAHCPSYADRLYNSSSAGEDGLVDPSLDSEYAAKLRLKCKSLDEGTGMLSEMDPGSYKTFDTSYYRHVAKRRGLFRSDAALLTDATTREYVQRVATGKFDEAFFRDFSESMIKMGNVGVLTGADGEIRKKCYVLN